MDENGIDVISKIVGIGAALVSFVYFVVRGERRSAENAKAIEESKRVTRERFNDMDKRVDHVEKEMGRARDRHEKLAVTLGKLTTSQHNIEQTVDRIDKSVQEIVANMIKHSST